MSNPPPSPPPAETGWLSWLTAVKGLTISNVLVIAALAAVAIPVYWVYRVLNDQQLLDRFMSSYKEFSSQVAPCTIRAVKERGGPERWSISAGFAFQGAERWSVGVILEHEPTNEEVISHCATLELIVQHMHGPAQPERSL